MQRVMITFVRLQAGFLQLLLVGLDEGSAQVRNCRGQQLHNQGLHCWAGKSLIWRYCMPIHTCMAMSNYNLICNAVMRQET